MPLTRISCLLLLLLCGSIFDCGQQLLSLGYERHQGAVAQRQFAVLKDLGLVHLVHKP